jgi:hypothetical protein
MYGMVNNALEGMIQETRGEAVWQEIRQKAKVTVPMFLSNEGYPDELTYQLVGAASGVLQESPEVLLEGFGHYWVTRTAVEGYGHLLFAAGSSLKEFLLYLPNFHVRVQLLLPNLAPPRFECTDMEEKSLRLHYYSSRPGLASFVQGALRGLAEVYKTKLSSTQIADRKEGADHDVFLLRWE